MQLTSDLWVTRQKNSTNAPNKIILPLFVVSKTTIGVFLSQFRDQIGVQIIPPLFYFKSEHN